MGHVTNDGELGLTCSVVEVEIWLVSPHVQCTGTFLRLLLDLTFCVCVCVCVKYINKKNKNIKLKSITSNTESLKHRSEKKKYKVN